MELCSRNHKEVCYEDGSCPVCELSDELDDVKSDLESARDEIVSAEDRVHELENEVEDLQQQVSELETKLQEDLKDIRLMYETIKENEG